MGDLTLADLVVGDRVEMAAHTDAWMRGDRYAKVEGVGTKMVTLRFERSGRSMRIHPVQIERKANPRCAECGMVARYTIDDISLCSSHRGLLAKFQPLPEPEKPQEYVAQPGDYCYYEGEHHIVHVDPCPKYEPGTLTDRKTGRVVGKKEI